MCEKIAINQALVEEAVLRHFDDAGGSNKSRPDSNMISEIQNVVNRALAKAFGSAAFHSVVYHYAQKCEAERQIIDDVATNIIDTAALIVSGGKYIKREVEKGFPDTVTIEERFKKLD